MSIELCLGDDLGLLSNRAYPAQVLAEIVKNWMDEMVTRKVVYSIPIIK